MARAIWPAPKPANMSEAHEIYADIVDDRESYTSDPVVNLRTGVVFRAEIEPVDSLLAQAELGEDAREVVCLHIRNDVSAEALRSQDRVQFTLFGETVIYKIVKRRNNAAGPLTDFWAIQIVGNKDSV